MARLWRSHAFTEKPFHGISVHSVRTANGSHSLSWQIHKSRLCLIVFVCRTSSFPASLRQHAFGNGTVFLINIMRGILVDSLHCTCAFFIYPEKDTRNLFLASFTWLTENLFKIHKFYSISCTNQVSYIHFNYTVHN